MLRFGASRSIRRSATVMISQLEAACAAVISSTVRNLPVPSISRERNDLPPISRRSSLARAAGGAITWAVDIFMAPSDDRLARECIRHSDSKVGEREGLRLFA